MQNMVRLSIFLARHQTTLATVSVAAYLLISHESRLSEFRLLYRKLLCVTTTAFLVLTIGAANRVISNEKGKDRIFIKISDLRLLWLLLFLRLAKYQPVP